MAKDYSWMNPEAPAVPQSESDIAHAYAARIASEYLRLKNKLNTGIAKMDIGISKAEAGANIMGLIEHKATELREREPSLTKEQAFAKIYTAPENRSLRAAERWAHGFHEYAPVENEHAPAVTGDPIAKQSAALDALSKLASDRRRANPGLSPEQAFAKIYSDPSNRELAMAGRASRAMIGA